MPKEIKTDVHLGWGRRLAEARRNAGLTQHQLALKIGAHDVTIARWETNTRRPTVEDQALVAAALGVPVATIFPRDADEASLCT